MFPSQSTPWSTIFVYATSKEQYWYQSLIGSDYPILLTQFEVQMRYQDCLWSLSDAELLSFAVKTFLDQEGYSLRIIRVPRETLIGTRVHHLSTQTTPTLALLAQHAANPIVYAYCPCLHSRTSCQTRAY